MAVIAMVGQKGGGGKSTLARAVLAEETGKRGKNVLLLDLDSGQHTSSDWTAPRRLNSRKPVKVEAVGFDDDALAAIEEAEQSHGLVIVDARGHSDEQTLDLAGVCDLLVIPAAPNADDLRPAAVLFHELTEAGGNCALVLNRVGSPAQSKWARAKLAETGISPLDAELPEQLTYQNAPTYGRAITEVEQEGPRNKAKAVVAAIMKLAKARKRKEPLRFTVESL